jgi:hypothetical protein
MTFPSASARPSRQRPSASPAVILVALFLATAAVADPNLAGAPARTPSTLSHGEAVSYFLLNCAYFGGWQGELDPTSSKVLRIGILGADPLALPLDSVAQRAREAWFSDGKILVERADSPEALIHSHLVFVSASESDNLLGVLQVFRNKPVLLVSEIPGFVRQGGIIEVRILEEHLQFDVNLDALEASHLTLASNMKKRATAFIKAGKRVPNSVAEGGTP